MKTKSLGLMFLSLVVLIFAGMYIFDAGTSFTLPSMNVFDFELPSERWDVEETLSEENPLVNVENVIRVVSPENGTIVGSPVTIDGTLERPERVRYTITDTEGAFVSEGSFRAGTEWNRQIIWPSTEGTFIFEFQTDTTSTQVFLIGS